MNGSSTGVQSPPHAQEQPTVVVAATFTADPIEEVLAFWASELGQPIAVRLAPYSQVFQQLFDPTSEAATTVGGVNAFAVRVEDWGLTPGRPVEEAEQEAAGKAREFAAAVKAAAARFSARILVCLCPASRLLLGMPPAAAAVRRVEAALASSLRAISGVRVLTSDEIAAAYPLEDYDFPSSVAHGHVPYTEAFFAALGTLIVRALRAAIASPVKVLVLDCDETLWKGVVGEDGPMGVSVDSAHRALQEFARSQRAAGMLLCLCSKNVEEDVAAVLDSHPDMLLRREDFVALRVNWDAKSDNLRSLAQELNVGLDSLVLLDDNPLECAEVRSRCPEVITIQLPTDLETLPSFLSNLWFFDRDAATAEDSLRSEFYQQNAERDALLRQADSLADFLANLELNVRIFVPEQRHLARVAQLTQRTNQFNTTTIRRQESEIAGLLRSGRGECLAVEVSDRFGDYGLVGVTFFAIERNALVVESLILSCRALGRGVEQRIVAQLGAIAMERGLIELSFLFAPTPKNQPARRFFESLPAPDVPASDRMVYRLDPHAATMLQATATPAASNEEKLEPGSSASQLSLSPSSPFRLNGERAQAIASEYVTADAIRLGIITSRRRRRPALASEYTAPKGQLQAILTRLWGEALGIDRVGVDDDFFELGGTSLQAAMLANTVQGALKRPFDSLSVFEAPTVGAMARLLELERETGPSPIRAVAGTGKVREGPLSPAQQRLWFLDQFNSGSVVYNEGRALRLTGVLDGLALEKAFAALIARHECLRTSFPVFDGRAVQRVEPRRPFLLPLVELGNCSDTSQLDEASRCAGQELARPFDLAAGPPFRAGLFRLAERDHVLWLVFHHILADGLSVRILFRELAVLYNAELAQRPPDLPKLSIQYLDFASWQRDTQHDQRNETHRAYWKQRLAGKLPPLQLPADRPRPAVLTYNGSRLPFKVPKDMVEALRAIGRREQATLFMTLMAALQVLLFRHSGQEDVIVGFPSANRGRQELEGLIGFFVNTLPLRTDLADNPRFTEVLRQVRRRAVEAYAHQDVPFEKLVDDLISERDLARTPIFQVMLALLDDPLPAFDVPGLRCTALEVPVTTTRFDLVLNLEENTDGLVGGLEYSTDLFDRDTIERLVGHLHTLLESIIADPEQPIGRLTILTSTERRDLLAQHTYSQRFEGSICLHRGFEAQVARAPDAVALVFEGSSITYDALNRQANQLAHHLISKGVKTDTLVGLCVDRSIEMVVGIFGILKAGGAYVPLDPTYPPDRLEFLLRDSAVPVLVTQERHLGNINAPGVAICLDRDSSMISNCDDSNPHIAVAPEHIAYVIYTSGSTGKPKGVLVTHRNVARLFEATNAWYGFGTSDVWTLFHSFAFDFSVWELWGALLYGGRLVIVPYWVSRSPDAFHELLCRERVTVLNQTPSAFRQLIQADASSSARPADMALRYVIFGGEALELQSLRPWFRRYGDAQPRLINMYGITETTVHVTYRPITLADVEAGAGSVIGVPIPDLEIYILDPNREPVPIGLTGELYVGGAGLARGYLHRPDLTSERFVANAFDGSSRLYRTGDLARRLAGGDLEYLGRIDQQVKIRGFRIELGEIETTIGEHPAVRETVVLARDAVSGEKQLVAYVSLNAASPGTMDELRGLVSAKLPAYMVPAHFVSLPTLPLTAHGKIDRKALPAPGRMRTSGRLYVPPSTPAEQTMADIWASVLGVEQVGIEDNFFELGGDSILSIQVIAKCRQSGLGVTPRDLFRTPTIAGLAATGRPAPEAAVVGAPTHGEIPLTPIQRWFFERVGGAEVHHWNQAFLFDTPCDLDVDVLERALQHVVHQHDAFRLRFTGSPTGWRQEYGPEPVATIMRVDLSVLSQSDQGAAIATRATTLGARLNVTDGPLHRAAHFDLGPGVPGRLLFVIHHLAVDGVSWRILLEDLESAYWSLQENRPILLTGKTASYGAWAECFAKYASSEARQRSQDYWRQVIEAKVAPLPIDHVGGDNIEGTADVVLEHLAEEETRALLRDVSAAYGARINEVLLSALARSLSSWTGEAKFRLELEGHGREPPFGNVDLSRIVGWFTTIYPVTLEIDPSQDDRHTLLSIGRQLRRVPDQGMSYATSSDVPEALRSAELIFNYLGQFDHVVSGSRLFKFAAESAGAWHHPRARRTHAIEVLLRVAAGRLEIQWIFSPALHDRSTIEGVSASFASELRRLIRQASAAVERFAAISPDAVDRYQLTPMQHLFHAMADTGYEAWRFAIEGEVDAARLCRAWEMLLDRHTILRTAFITDGAYDPLQFVLRHVKLPPLTEVDLRGLDDQSQQQRIREMARIEQERGFDLSVAPLIRVALVRLGDRHYEMLWSTHHLYVDGWSWPVLIADLSELYGALGDGREPSLLPACPYGRYVDWLEHEAPDGECFWRQELAGFLSPSPIDLDEAEPASETSGEPEEAVVTLAYDATEALTEVARNGQTTLAVVVQGAWALLLSHIGAIEDVVFGAAYSGRPAEMPGIEGMVGPCVNNIPVRVRVDTLESVDAYIARLQQKQPDLSHHQFSPLGRIQECTGVPRRLRLFNSLIVFQNYVIGEASRRMGSSASVRLIEGPDATNYPLTLVVVPGPRMQLKLRYQSRGLTRPRAESLLADLVEVFTAMGANSKGSIGSILARLPEETRGRATTIAARRRERKSVGAEAPASSLEQRIAMLWGELFQLESVDPDDNFFDLGGHSLLLLEAHRRLRAQIQTNLPVVALFRYPTVRSLSRFLGGGNGSESNARDVFARANKQKEALARMTRPRLGR